MAERKVQERKLKARLRRSNENCEISRRVLQERELGQTLEQAVSNVREMKGNYVHHAKALDEKSAMSLFRTQTLGLLPNDDCEFDLKTAAHKRGRIATAITDGRPWFLKRSKVKTSSIWMSSAVTEKDKATHFLVVFNVPQTNEVQQQFRERGFRPLSKKRQTI
jgi:hypothetical protein